MTSRVLETDCEYDACINTAVVWVRVILEHDYRRYVTKLYVCGSCSRHIADDKFWYYVSTQIHTTLET